MCEKPKKSWVWHECISKPQLWVMWKIKQTSANNCHLLTTDVVLYTFTDCASFTPKKIFFEQNKLIFCHRTYCWNIPAVFVTQCSSASLTLLKWSLKSFLFGIRNGRSLLHIAATTTITFSPYFGKRGASSSLKESGRRKVHFSITQKGIGWDGERK